MKKYGEEIMNGYAVCHGEPDYHHILIGKRIYGSDGIQTRCTWVCRWRTCTIFSEKIMEKT